MAIAGARHREIGEPCTVRGSPAQRSTLVRLARGGLIDAVRARAIAPVAVSIPVPCWGHRPGRQMAPAKKSAASGDAALETARKVALRGILDDCSASAPSTSPGGRDQGLVRRSQTRHHDVRHWSTSFPLLHLFQQMAPRSPGVKEISPGARQGGPIAGGPSRFAAAGSRIDRTLTHRSALPLDPGRGTRSFALNTRP
jgi:hypothetical protein